MFACCGCICFVVSFTRCSCRWSVEIAFQVPSPDAVYNRDKEKNSDANGHPNCLGAHAAHILLEEGVVEGRD